jgi:6-phosphogluconolactonase (cycloisomerase 2 family)
MYETKAGGGTAREQGKRMKGMSSGHMMKALAVTVATGLLGLSACSRDYTLAYVYATSATRTTNGVINAYSVDYQSGALQQLPDSPIPSGGSNPVTLVASPSGKYLYVLNHDTSTVVQFDIGTDGKLYPENTYNVVQGSGATGTFPTAAAIDAAGKYLYVAFTYQNGFTTATPGPGGIAIFPIGSDGSLGTAVTNTTVGTTIALPYVPVGFNPVGIVASAYNNYVYVVEQDTTVANGVSTQTGTILAFSENTSTGALTPVVGTVPVTVNVATGATLTGFRAGTKPSAIVEDPSARFVYVTDQLTDQLYGYGVTSTGALASIPSSPFSTGNFPLGLTIDPRGAYVYVANFGDSTLSGYAINTATGALSGVSGSSGGGVSTGPTCVTVEPALGKYLYTSNNTDPTISAAQLNPNTGALTGVQGTPYTAQVLPTCVVSVANGSHATQLVTP